jgi:nicotinamidase-related amidase
MAVHLLIIDPQNSFCDPEGELYVANAESDMSRLAGFIEKNGSFIDRITVTLDSHNPVHIAHPAWWIDRHGCNPDPFTTITAEDLLNGSFRTSDPIHQAWSLSYLEKSGAHTVWPRHCLIGSWGHEVYAPLKASLDRWAVTGRDLDFLPKGFSRFTEHFSAVKPLVEVPGDPCTLPNRALVDALLQSDTVLVAGEAASHCVAETVKDLIFFGNPAAGKIVLLKDAMSPVGGCEPLAEAFYTASKENGVVFSDTVSYRP